MQLIDLSHEIENQMPVFPGDKNVKLLQDKRIERDFYNNFVLETGMHVGTHIDTPMHMIKSDKMVSDYPLEHFCGKGVLINAYNQPTIRLTDDIKSHIKNGDIVLIYTGHDKLYNTQKYYKEYPILSQELAELLIEREVKIVGMDTPSPDLAPFTIHKMFFNEGIFVIENLCHLEQLVDVKQFEVYAFPLKIKADASLLRVVAKIV